MLTYLVTSNGWAGHAPNASTSYTDITEPSGTTVNTTGIFIL